MGDSSAPSVLTQLGLEWKLGDCWGLGYPYDAAELPQFAVMQYGSDL